MHPRIRRSFRFLFLVGTIFVVHSKVEGQQAANSEGLKLGEAAPDFELPNIEGQRVRLSDYRENKNVVLVFYPAMFRAGG